MADEKNMMPELTLEPETAACGCRCAGADTGPCRAVHPCCP